MKIFVTGSSGFIGIPFIQHLLKKIKKTDTVYLLQRTPKKYSTKNITTIEGNLETIEKHSMIISSCDYIFHLAAEATFGDDLDYISVNYHPVVKITNIIKKSKKEIRFIFISTIGAYDRNPSDNCKKPITISSKPFPTSEYGKSKLLAENYIKENISNYTIIRPAWVYGKNMRDASHINQFISMSYENSIVEKLNFPGRVSLIYVDDLCKALVNCINNDTTKNKEYFAATQSKSIGEIFKIIHKKIYLKNIKQIPVIGFTWLIRRIHKILPLALSNLFVDYLYTEDKNFINDLLKNKIKEFNEHLIDVISTNKYNSRYWVITGANSGIGYELASELNKENKKLLLIDKNIENIKLFKNQKVIKSDLTKKSEIANIIEQISDKKIYCLINNAGIGYKKSFDKITTDEIESTIMVNIYAPLYLTKGLLNNLIKNKSIIVNIGSSIAYNPLPFMSIYSASKAFIVNWTESLMYELKKTNKVISFSPSGTATNFQRSSGVKHEADGKGLLSANYVALKILNAIRTNKTITVLGFSTNILLSISKIIPRKFNVILWGKLFEKLK
jgi:uncharacterized protein